MNAVARNGKPKSPVFHSDRGSQYSRRMVQQLPEEYGIKGSIVRILVVVVVLPEVGQAEDNEQKHTIKRIVIV